MKEDIITILTLVFMWLAGCAVAALTFFVLGVFAKLAWIPFIFGWNLVF